MRMTTLAVTGAIQRRRAMANPLAATIHFRSSFEMRATTSDDLAWSRLIKSVRHWVESSPQLSPPTTNEAFFTAWFFLGGEWKAPGPQYRIVRTSRLIGDGDDQAPQYWAMRYEHSGDDTGRTWRMDIGVVRTETSTFQISVVLSHYMREGYIGKEPAAPLPTSPRLVGWLLNSSGWEAFAGALRLRSNPAVLKEGDGEEFRRLLEDPKRLAPIVLVSRDFKTGKFLIDPSLLSRKLAGAAAVYESESSLVDKELEWCLGKRFSCWNGMVRVYQPGLRFDRPGSARRQRYFSGREIVEQGADAIVEMLVRGVARRAEIVHLPALASIDDIVAIERDRRMAELKSHATDEDQAEWVQLLESTNADLEQSDREKHDAISQLRSENADLSDTISRLEYDKRTIQHRAREAEQKCESLQSRADAIDGLRRLPKSMRDVVDLVSRIHPGRIAGR